MPGYFATAAHASARAELRSAAALWLLVRVLGLALLAPLLARIPLPRLLPRLTPRPPRRRDHRLAYRALLFTSGYLRRRPRLRNPCLVRGLTLYPLLRRAGLPVVIHFGILPDGRSGHCWLTLDGEPLLEPQPPQERYLEMYRYPAPDPLRPDAGGFPGKSLRREEVNA